MTYHRCIKDFFMDTGERSYTAGKTYGFELNGSNRHGLDDQGCPHYMADHYISTYFVPELA